MARDDRFYAFIIAHTSRSKARVQRIRIEKRVVTTFFAAVLVVALGFELRALRFDPAGRASPHGFRE